MKLFKLFVFALILSSCSGPADLEHLMISPSEFNMDTSALHDGDKIEIIGLSGNLTKEHSIDFYNLVVVRSMETGDTVNVLATTFIDASMGRNQSFMSRNSSIGLIMETASESPESIDGKNVNNMKPKKFRKVLYDTEFIPIDVRKYPTIIGMIGNFTIMENSNEEKIDYTVDSLLNIEHEKNQ